MISDEVFKIIMDNKDRLNSAIIHKRDERIDFFGFKTLERSYLLKIDGVPAERIQHMWMRVSVGIWGDNIDKAIETYNTMSNKYATHATPTLFNAGTKRPQMSSCFLIAMKEDSIEGIYDTLKQSALISQSAGGIGLHIHNVRAQGSYIKGTNGYSNGIVPMLRNFDMTARYVDQGGGKRKGSIAIYLEPWHADIFEFLDLKKNHGKEEGRARDLFYALWVSDLFMERANSGGKWTLFSPDSAPGLSDCYGEEFDKLYVKYEEEGRGIKEVDARKLWDKILESQQETGTPYMLYKDAANTKSNQKNIGVIKSSNLCLVGETEVEVKLEYTDGSESFKTLTLEQIDYIIQKFPVLDYSESVMCNAFNEIVEETKHLHLDKSKGFSVVKNIYSKSMNTETGEVEFKKVTASAMTNPEAEVIKITDEETGKFIECTPEHKVWTKNRGYVMAKDLVETDELEIN